MTEQNEPSMEAILASIRSILAEDEEENPEAAPAEAEKTAPNTAAQESRPTDNQEKKEPPAEKPQEQEVAPEIQEPVVQNQPAEEEKEEKEEDIPAPSDFQNEKSDENSNENIMDLTADMIVDGPQESTPVQQEEVEEDDFTPEPVIPQEPMKEETLTDLIKETAAKQLEGDMLLAEPTVMAATESLSHLRDIAVERQLDLGNGALTIEMIVRETLKPYLKEWLDAHLPDIVERVVRKEVAHIMDRLDLK